jgi:predicted DNA-binding transcriptional regulator AlpA
MTIPALTLVAALTAAEGDVQEMPALSTKLQVAGPNFANCSTRHIEKMVVDGRFPAPIYLGSHPRWRRSDLLKWLNDQAGK